MDRPPARASSRGRPYPHPTPFPEPLIIPTRLIRLLVGLVALPGWLACDETFTPTEPGQLAFSIFGHLDAAADTQWIRVMPLRPVLLTSREPLGVTVTIEHVETGRTFELRDSTFLFTQHNDDVGSEGVFLHNFWTTERIEPGGTYRFSAESRSGARAEAVVQVSPEYGVEVWYGQLSGTRNQLRLAGLQHGAMIMITQFYDGCGPASWRQPLTSASTATDTLAMTITVTSPRRESCGPPQIEKREMLVIGSGSEWPVGAGYSPSALGGSGGPSNIDNAIGFLGGVLTRSIPLETCQIERFLPSDVWPYCVLRYNSESVTLTGTATDQVCGGPVVGATVRLREIDPDPVEGRKLRVTSTIRGGGYEVGALEAGTRYQLTIRQFDAEGMDLYREHADTLVFSPGARVTHDLELVPLLPCGGS